MEREQTDMRERKNEANLVLRPHTKISAAWITELNTDIRSKTITFLGKKPANFHDLRLGIVP